MVNKTKLVKQHTLNFFCQSLKHYAPKGSLKQKKNQKNRTT
jgi:hypothetical protein